MANDVTGVVCRIDTFGADVTIRAGSCNVIAILPTAYSSAKTVVFVDSDGAEVWRAEVASDSTAQFTPAKRVRFPKGLIFDESASDLAAGDYIYIYLDA